MTSGKRRIRGELSPEDRALWSKVTRTLTPLHPEKPSASHEDEIVEQTKQVTKAQSVDSTETAIRTPVTPRKPPPPPPLNQLEHRYRRKLIRGVKPIDARVDLHGLTQDRAHDRLRGFLYSAQAQGFKIVLVITGKGGQGGGFMDERGVLRRVVPQWLAMPDMRSVVVGYEEAHQTHGGSGALYVRIRRRR